MQYELVLFDIGDTLVHVPKPAPIYTRLLCEHGYAIEPERMHEILDETRRVIDVAVPNWVSDDFCLDVSASTRRRELHVETILELAGAARDASLRQTFFDLYVGTQFFTLFPDVPETLEALRARGFHMGIVSNWERRLDQLCASHGIARFFDFVVVSEVEGYVKPHAHLYRRALELAGCPPERVVHVGDRMREDVEAARSVGISAVLLDRDGAADGVYQPTIRDLPSLLPLLNGAW